MLQRMGEASGVTFAADIEPMDGLLPGDGGINLYRIVQEAANNIVKHAKASRAQVTLKRLPLSIHLSISDDGRGLPAGTLASSNGAGGFGLRSLAARTRLLGGRHQIESKPGVGTTITVEIPIGGPRDEPCQLTSAWSSPTTIRFSAMVCGRSSRRSPTCRSWMPSATEPRRWT